MIYDETRRAFTKLGGKTLSLLSSFVFDGEVPELYWRQVYNLFLEKGKPASLHKALSQLAVAMKRHFVKHEVEFPEALKHTWRTPGGTRLYTYQREAVPLLVAGSLILGDEMGLGKTLCALHAWWCMGMPQMTIIAPSDSVADEWVIALEQHYGITRGIVCLRSRKDLANVPDASVVIIPYSRFWREGYWEAILNRVDKEGILVFDEAHRLANLSSRQHQAAEHLCRFKKPRRWLLTGTEVANTPQSYHGLYVCVTLSPLPLVAYMNYIYDNWTGQWRENRLKEIRSLRNTFALRRTRSMLNEQLPPLTLVDIRVPLDDVSSVIYDDLKQTAQAEIRTLTGEGVKITEVNYMTCYGRLLRLCSHPSLIGEARVDETPKLIRFLDLVEDAGDQKILVWSNYPRAIIWLQDKVAARFPKLRLAVAHGGVSQEDRALIKREFQAGGIDMIIANPAVWSEGVNLTAASVNIYWDQHPSRVRWEQSKARSHRTGQTKPVTIYRLQVRGSVEEKTVKYLERKATLAQLVAGV